MKHTAFWFDGKFYDCYRLDARIWDECKHDKYRDLLFPISSDDNRKAFILKGSSGRYIKIEVDDWVYKSTNSTLMPMPSLFIKALESAVTNEVKDFG